MKVLKNNSDFLFGFEAVLTNPNGDPDQENKPRMDYETSTLLVSDARRKRDIRDFLKNKGYKIFVDTLADDKVPMNVMFDNVIDNYLKDHDKLKGLLDKNEDLKKKYDELFGGSKADISELYHSDKLKKDKNYTKFNNLLLTEIIKDSLIDIRLFGSAMAVENVSRTYTGPVQINWGYSMHPVELVKSNTITSIMNDDNSTFGKKHKVYYALVSHYGIINKNSAKLTGMTEEDKNIFRKALIQGMMDKQTDSKQGQNPLFYLEIEYNEAFDGYLGDMRRFLDVEYDENRPIRDLKDLHLDFSKLENIINELKKKGYVKNVLGWRHPFAESIKLPDYVPIDLLEPIVKVED